LIYRRRRQQYIFAGFIAVIAVVNLLFFLILNRPAQTEYARMEDSILQLRGKVAKDKNYLKNLVQTSGQLDEFDERKRALLTKHMIERNTGYSHIVTTLDGIVNHSGVNKTRVALNLDPKTIAGLSTVSITVPLEGNYNNIVSFVRELEDSDTFFLINQIQLEGSRNENAQPVQTNAGSSGSVALSLGVETFFYQ
jgi:Tfp pilus assembly protein PilO